MLKGKKIILAVTGSIAAYKAAFLVRLLIKEGAEVQVLMTSAAAGFITPLTLATLSKKPVLMHYTANDSTGEWNNHVALGMWADLMLIAPLSAHTLAKLAHGICDNLVMATYLSAKCPVMVAPAMDLDMYRHPTTVDNLKKLETFGNHVIQAESGELASGLEGQGRMAEPEMILHELKHYFRSKSSLSHQTVLITAGPTYEKIDPVRFIGNHSSGKMGYALAEEAAKRGAHVIVISGPTHLQLTHPNIEVIQVKEAAEMAEAVAAVQDRFDVGIFAAAVADYTPANKVDQKMKKTESSLSIDLKPTTDILKRVGDTKKPNQVTVGFALETENEEANAKGKLKRKNCNYLVLNSLNDAGAGFGHSTNKVKVFSADNKTWDFELMTKQQLAVEIWNILNAENEA